MDTGTVVLLRERRDRAMCGCNKKNVDLFDSPGEIRIGGVMRGAATPTGYEPSAFFQVAMSNWSIIRIITRRTP
jgi:hypothetical protein